MAALIERAVTEQGTVRVMNLSAVAGPMSQQTEFVVEGKTVKVPLSTEKDPFTVFNERTGRWLWRLNGQNKATDRGLRLYLPNEGEENAAHNKSMLALAVKQSAVISGKEPKPVPSAKALFPNYGPIAIQAAGAGVVTIEGQARSKAAQEALAAQASRLAAAQKGSGASA